MGRCTRLLNRTRTDWRRSCPRWRGVILTVQRQASGVERRIRAPTGCEHNLQLCSACPERPGPIWRINVVGDRAQSIAQNGGLDFDAAFRGRNTTCVGIGRRWLVMGMTNTKSTGPALKTSIEKINAGRRPPLRVRGRGRDPIARSLRAVDWASQPILRRTVPRRQVFLTLSPGLGVLLQLSIAWLVRSRKTSRRYASTALFSTV